MISLFLDTSYNYVIVAIFKDLKQVYFKSYLHDNDLSTKVLIYIDDAFKSLNIDSNDIDKIFVVNGPGSFTGVRIGVTVAKTMAWGLNKKIIPISELEVLSSGFNGNVVPMIDARRNCVYSAMYDAELNCLIKDQYEDLEKMVTKVNRKKLENVIYTSYDTFADKDVVIPKIDLEKVINKHVNDKDVNAHKIKPNYLKRTEAEEKLIDSKK